jgi:hypothetical protein
MEDRGSLTVSPGKLVFHGKTGTVEISDISNVSTKRHGLDFVNRWITVSYGGGQTALFVDGTMLGWGQLRHRIPPARTTCALATHYASQQ